MQPAPRFRPPRLSTALAFILLAATALTLTLAPLRSSHDEFWHLKTGQYIEQNGLPENDIFTYMTEDAPWHNHEWLAQLALWKIFKWGEVREIGGFRTVIFVKALWITLTFMGLGLFMARRADAPALAAWVAALGCVLAKRTVWPRPPFITYGLLALVLILCIVWRDRRRRVAWLFALAPLFCLWANLHGGFMAGLVVLGAFWIESAADWALAAWRLEPTAPSRRRWMAWTFVLALCALATLLNPYGYHLYELPGRVMNDKLLLPFIFEMHPPDWNFVWIADACIVLMLFGAIRPRRIKGWIVTTLVAVGLLYLWRGSSEWLGEGARSWTAWLREAPALVLILAAAARSKAAVGLGSTLLALFFTHQGLQHVRHLPLMAIFLVPLMAQTLADWMRSTVGHWDWLLVTQRPADRSPEAQVRLRERRMRQVQFGSLVLIALTAAFQIFMPGEAHYWLHPDELGSDARLGDMLLSPSSWDRNRALLAGVEMDPNAYPTEAVDYILAHQSPGRIWNGGNYAGYLIWRLWPRYKVFTDNRYDIYGGRFLPYEWMVLDAWEPTDEKGERGWREGRGGFIAYKDLMRLGWKLENDAHLPDWREMLVAWGVHTLFIPTDRAIQTALETDRAAGGSAWTEGFHRGGWAVWTRGDLSGHGDAL